MLSLQRRVLLKDSSFPKAARGLALKLQVLVLLLLVRLLEMEVQVLNTLVRVWGSFNFH